MKTNRYLPLIALAGVVAFSPCAAAEAPATNPLKLWYRQPAQSWEEALPGGNGRIGAMVFGDPLREHLQLNESTIWTGVPKSATNDLRAREVLTRQAELVLAGKYAEAGKLKLEDVPSPTRPQTQSSLVLSNARQTPMRLISQLV